MDQGNDESKNIDADLPADQEFPPAREEQTGGTPAKVLLSSSDTASAVTASAQTPPVAGTADSGNAAPDDVGQPVAPGEPPSSSPQLQDQPSGGPVNGGPVTQVDQVDQASQQVPGQPAIGEQQIGGVPMPKPDVPDPAGAMPSEPAGYEPEKQLGDPLNVGAMAGPYLIE